MREDFLHYLWKYQFFAINKLYTTNKESLHIYKIGNHNINSGPDFFNAKIKIADQLWAGNVEIHVKASDWYAHRHEEDPNYDNVILHVVWQKNTEIYNKVGVVIPTLELQNFVTKRVLVQYQKLFSKKQKWINCENFMDSVDLFVLDNWVERLYFERLEQKSELISELLIKSANNWEMVLFQLLTKNFGLKVNGSSFLNLANSVTFDVVRKEQNKQLNLEALFFGQAGFLAKDLNDEYYKKLQKEYQYQQVKYILEPLFNGQFQFFRLRPNNFPTIRLAQLASLYFRRNNLFSEILEIDSLDGFYELFDVSASSFWENHYTFKTNSRKQPKKTTKKFINLLLINTIIPIKFMYLKHIGKLKEEDIVRLMKQIPSEKNNIITRFEIIFKNQKNFKIQNAFKSQALLQLKTAYCDNQNCLQCAIGNFYLKNE